jgi:hypothetical protein
MIEDNQLLIYSIGIIGGISAWIIRKLFRDLEKLSNRAAILERNLVDRPYLESQLAPMRRDLNLILSHLLEHRTTEGSSRADKHTLLTDS